LCLIPKDLRGFTGFENFDFVLHGSLLFSLRLVPKDLRGFTGFENFDFVLHFDLQKEKAWLFDHCYVVRLQPKNCAESNHDWLLSWIYSSLIGLHLLYSQRMAPSLFIMVSFEGSH
jgi:hypothetical protein